MGIAAVGRVPLSAPTVNIRGSMADVNVWFVCDSGGFGSGSGGACRCLRDEEYCMSAQG